jgi:hypothetical protein
MQAKCSKKSCFTYENAKNAQRASNLIVSFTFLTLIAKLGASSTFLLYAFASVASWLFAYYFVPETRGHTLEEIEAFWRARHHVRQMGARIS